ncbi:AGE family epimerase/isomerase [Granulosicoccus sp. 3-233]|uniref:AGE family epimerase/isomerase n=1 Tax=Granulosicoccus sp. 3-233 TaxID=3417969 RepID=UPI003D35456F
MSIPDSPAFESPDFLQQHIRSILDFYEPRVIGPEAGLRSCFLDNGDCFDPHSRQLVGSARYVVNYATAYRLYGKTNHRQWAERGLDYLTQVHRQENGRYAWLLEKDEVVDDRVMAYGHAFVLLAAASCLRAGVESARQTLYEVHAFMERYFWDDTACAYADERNASLEQLDDYRGQNANMHMCEALLAAWQATADSSFLDRAERLAERFALDLASQSGGQIWEHYDQNWQVDMQYNIDKPNDRYKPWGFQPGHQVEWSKLLLILDGERPDEKWLPRARDLYDGAMSSGWDTQHGGLVYGVAPDGDFCAAEKYFWVQSEAFAAAWRLYRLTGEQRFLDDYRRIWQWSWEHLVDHRYGAWFRVRNRDGSAIDDRKSPLGKTDYHTMGACWDVLSQPLE